MGHVLLMTDCAGCGATMQCNPYKVPSLRVTGVKEPICRHCFDRWNQIHRIDKGLEPVALQAGAYDAHDEKDGMI
jgi:Fe-S-cluster-containing dehydrogenase component